MTTRTIIKSGAKGFLLFGVITTQLLSPLYAAEKNDFQWPQPSWTPRIISEQLDNGFRYFVYNSDKSNEPFNLRLIVNAGAIDEENQRGIAHALEHMVFRTTAQHPETIHRYLQQIGWKTGLEVNAMTSMSETQYMIRTRPHDSLDVAGAVTLLSELALHARIEQSEWQQERKIVLEEMRQKDGLAKRINDKKRSIARHDSRYADRSTIGSREDLLKSDAATLRAFYHHFYQPANMVLVASGNVDVAALRQAVKRTFGAVPNREPIVRPYLTLPLKPQLTIRTIQEPQGTSSQVALGLRSALPPLDTLAGKKASFENYFLRNLLKSQIKVGAEALPDGVSSINAVLDEPTEQRLTLAVSAKTLDHRAGLQLILEQLERLRRSGFDQQAFNALKEQARASLARNEEQVAGRDFAKWEDKITEAVLKGSVIEAPEIYEKRTTQWLNELTVADLNLRLQQLLAAPDRFIYFQRPGTQHSALPDERDIKQMMDAVHTQPLPLRHAPVSAPTPQQPVKHAVKAPPLPEPQSVRQGAIVNTHRFAAQPVIHWQLSNGDRVVWLKRKTANGQLFLRAISNGGFDNDRYPSVVSQSAVQIWQQSGFAFWRKEQNDAYLASKTPHWKWELKAHMLDLAAMAKPAQLPALLREYVTYRQDGQIRSDVLAAVRQDIEKGLSQQPSDLTRVWNALASVKNNSQPAAMPTLGELRQAARDHLAAPVTLYVVGEMDERQLAAQVTRYLASQPRQASLSASPNPGAMAGVREMHLPYNQENVATVRVEARTPMRWTPEQAFVVSSLNPLIQSALKEELRLTRSGVYSIAFEMNLDISSNDVVSTLSFSCDPIRADELHRAALDVLSRLAQSLTPGAIKHLQEDVIYAESTRQKDDNSMLHRLILSDRAYGDPRYLEHQSTLPKRINQAELERTIRAIFPQPNRASLITLPRGHLVTES